MTLGDIFKEAAKKDLSVRERKGIKYEEQVKDGMFEIRLSCDAYKEAFIECSVPFNFKEEEKNYCWAYFLSMVFNAAIYGMKRMKEPKRKDIPLELRQLENYCESKKLSVKDLIEFHRKWENYPHIQ